MNKRVFVGISGGVDSAVSAALLKRAGYDVTGVFMKVWQPDWIECTWREERRDAMRVAAHLGIPFVTLDLESEYKKGVIDKMISEYSAGRTPNPDVLCNREVKFGAFWKWAKENGADYIATGHYAQVGKNHTLLAGADDKKDQSYFLWTLTKDDLAHVMFPIGHMKKPAVRAMARKLKFPNAEKKDSQGLCFIGHVDIKEFLAKYTEGNPASKPGIVLDVDGKNIGAHPGSLFFTIGERHGFTLHKKSPNDEPLYVTRKDIAQNTITVATRGKRHEMASASMKQVDIDGASWVGKITPVSPIQASPASLKISKTGKTGVKLLARTRYRQKLSPISAVEKAGNGKIRVTFAKPEEALAPGQSLVIYVVSKNNREECLGGGVICDFE